MGIQQTEHISMVSVAFGEADVIATILERLLLWSSLEFWESCAPLHFLLTMKMGNVSADFGGFVNSKRSGLVAQKVQGIAKHHQEY